MTFVDRPLPASFEVPSLRPPKKRPPGPGRPKGSVNKVVRDLKEGILTAAENIGSDGNGEGGLVGYLEDLGRHHKRAFASLLVKVLPMTISNAAMGSHIGVVNIVSVPSDNYLSAADIDRLSRPGHAIEHDDREPDLPPEAA